jgi:hypothetical protein
MQKTLLLAVSAVALGVPAQAQDRPVLAPGDRVRVTVGTPPKLHAGTLEAVRGDTLVLRGKTVQLVPVDSVRLLEVSRGRHRRTWSGAWVGALAGAGAGVLFGALASSCEGDDCAGSTGEWIAASALGLGVVGGLVGALAGALTETDTWEEVPVGQLRAVEPMRQDEAAEAPAPEAERASPASGQPARRTGMWGGFGAGAVLDEQAEDWVVGPAAYARMGGTATPHLLVGGEVGGWYGSEADEWWAQGNMLLTALVYPSAHGRLFMKIAMGLAARVNELPPSTGVPGPHWSAGFGANAGLGYDVPLGRAVALTPNLEVLYQTTSGSGLAVLLTVGLTWH